MAKKNKYFPSNQKKCIFAASKTAGCSAVGSALRSGRRGRKFESSHPDQAKKAILWGCFFFMAIIEIPPFAMFTAEWCVLQKNSWEKMVEVIIGQAPFYTTHASDRGNHPGTFQ